MRKPVPFMFRVFAGEEDAVCKRMLIQQYTLILVAIISVPGCSSLPHVQSAIIDDYPMAYAVKGEAAPVVVFESGFGTPMENWSKVFPEVATFSTVFAYNRRGYKGSGDQVQAEQGSLLKDVAGTVGDIAFGVLAPTASMAVDVVKTTNAVVKSKDKDDLPELRTAQQAVEELRSLLVETGLEPPYVLVGHSLGGLYTLYYAKTYPQEVAGVVLVDSSHPEQLQRCRERYGDSECDTPRLMNFMMKILPDELLGEFHGMEESGRQVVMAGPLQPMPLVVLSRGKVGGMASSPISAMWPEFQEALAAQLPDSTHVIAEKSGHFIQKDQPQLVIDAIKQVVNSVRDGSGSEH